MPHPMVDALPKTAQQQYAQLKQWIDSQPHFPKNIEEKLIVRFLHSNFYDLEKAKANAEVFFDVRASLSDVLSKRDPCAPHIQKVLKIVNLAQYCTGKRNIWIWQLNDPGLDNYDYVEDARLFFSSSDTWILSSEELEEEDIGIMDVKDISLKFLTKLNVSVAKKLSKYQEDAMPIRLKSVHIINCPPVIDKIYAVMKPFLKPEMTKMINFHTPKSSTLFDHISRNELPSDYGGTRDSMAELMTRTVQLLMDHREFLLDDTHWKSIKKAKNKGDKAESIETGSFRSLSID